MAGSRGLHLPLLLDHGNKCIGLEGKGEGLSHSTRKAREGGKESISKGPVGLVGYVWFRYGEVCEERVHPAS